MTVNAYCDCSAYYGACVRWSVMHSTVCACGLLPCSLSLSLSLCAMFEELTEFCFVFRFVFVTLCWISRRDSSVGDGAFAKLCVLPSPYFFFAYFTPLPFFRHFPSFSSRLFFPLSSTLFPSCPSPSPFLRLGSLG